MKYSALLALEDGSLFWGQSIGVEGETLGEVVFNTSMTGYQEILTDPSYFKQLVTLTYPHIGNVGVNSEDSESIKIMASGLIIKDCPPRMSNWRSHKSLPDYLVEHQIVAIAELDTRRLTRLLREKGALRGVILANEQGEFDTEAAIAKAQGFAGLKGMDLAKEVTCTEISQWTQSTWQLDGYQEQTPDQVKYKVVAYDFGVKHNILRILASKGCEIHLVPAQTPASEVLAMKPDGVFLSNGPGDPEPCDYAVQAIQAFLEQDMPLFGICLGHQLLALAAGAKTEKMKFGHHGANHPVMSLADKTVMITSQNHGFAVSEDSLPESLEATHVSLFDKSLQGIRHKTKPAFGFQGHPEASPGPEEAAVLFDQFIVDMQAAKTSK